MILTDDDKKHIAKTHGILHAMEKQGASEKTLDAFIKKNWFSFQYDTKFNYIGEWNEETQWIKHMK